MAFFASFRGATENAGLENAGLENAAPDCRVENAGVAQYEKPKSPLFNIVLLPAKCCDVS